MAYSGNTRLLVIGLVKQGHSAEGVVELLSRLLHGTGQTGYDTVSEIARSLSINFTRADWDELKYGIPDPKTIRKWVKEETAKGINGVIQNPGKQEPMLANPIPKPIDATPKGRHAEEWVHFEKIKEAIIKLQYAPSEKALELFDEIERERVTLDDDDIQHRLTSLIALERKMQEFDDKIPPEHVAKLIDLLSRRMHKRYKR
jgi:hypothetical protein